METKTEGWPTSGQRALKTSPEVELMETSLHPPPPGLVALKTSPEVELMETKMDRNNTEDTAILKTSPEVELMETTCR